MAYPERYTKVESNFPKFHIKLKNNNEIILDFDTDSKFAKKFILEIHLRLK
jgi:hypothetical protein